MVSRVAIAALLALAAGACTKDPAASGQANSAAPTAVAGTVTPDEAPASASAPKPGAVDRSHKGEAPPAAELTDLDGRPTTLGGTGKPLLVNLWATWCAPCVAEMPSLEKAATHVDIVALNQGDDAAKVRPFLAKAGITHLRPLLDPKLAVMETVRTSLPTTILYDRAGKEVWRIAGGRDWTTPESLKLIAEAG